MAFVEIPPNGIYHIDLNSDVNGINLLSWKQPENSDISSLTVEQQFLDLSWMAKDRLHV